MKVVLVTLFLFAGAALCRPAKVAAGGSCGDKGGFCIESSHCRALKGSTTPGLCLGASTVCCSPPEYEPQAVSDCKRDCSDACEFKGSSSLADRQQCERYAAARVLFYCIKSVAGDLGLSAPYEYSACQTRVLDRKPASIDEAACSIHCKGTKGKDSSAVLSDSCSECLGKVCRRQCILDPESNAVADMKDCLANKRAGLLDQGTCDRRCKFNCERGIRELPGGPDPRLSESNDPAPRAPAKRDRWGCYDLASSGESRGATVFDASPFASNKNPECLMASKFLANSLDCCLTTTNYERSQCFGVKSSMERSRERILQCKRYCPGDNGWFCRNR